MNGSFGTFDIDFTLIKTFNEVTLDLIKFTSNQIDKVMFDKVIDPLNY